MKRCLRQSKFAELEGPDKCRLVPRAGLEPARDIIPKDFKSFASTNSAIPAHYQYLKNIEVIFISKFTVNLSSPYIVF